MLEISIEKIKEELNSLGKELTAAKNNLLKLSGREEEVFAQIKTKHNIFSIEEAEKQIKIMEKSLQETTKAVETLYTELREVFQWE